MTEHEHTKTDGLGDMPLAHAGALPDAAWRAPPRSERMAANKIECNACPVLCQITEGKPGACDRYANQGGVLVRVDPVLLLARAQAGEAAATGELVPFVDAAQADEPAHQLVQRRGDGLGHGVDHVGPHRVAHVHVDVHHQHPVGRVEHPRVLAHVGGEEHVVGQRVAHHEGPRRVLR